MALEVKKCMNNKVFNYFFQMFGFCIMVMCFFTSCATSDFDSKKIEPVMVVKSISDSIFLSSQVSNLTYSNGKFYLSDFYRGVISFDETFENYEENNINRIINGDPNCYMFAIGEKGKVCLYDSKKRIFVNEENGSEYSKTEVRNCEVTQSSRFILSGDTIICPIIKDKKSAAIFNNGMLIGTCFSTIDGVDNVRMPYHSERILVRDKNHYFTIGKGIPYIQMFTSKFQHLFSYDLNNIQYVAQTAESEKSDKPNSYFVIIRDACVADNKLYILIASKNNGIYRCNNVLKFIIVDDKLELEGSYELKEKKYSTICINGSAQLVAIVSKSSCLEVYDL